MDIVIAEAVRSAVGRGHKGTLATKRPDELAADVIRGLMARVPQARGKIDDVVLGCAMPEGEQGLNVARLIALSADLGIEVPAQTINRFCSSGLQAIAIAAGSIAVGSNDVVIAGGVESMTMVPMTGFHLSASPELMAKLPGANTPMGITAENVAKRFGITRQMQDQFAYRARNDDTDREHKKENRRRDQRAGMCLRELKKGPHFACYRRILPQCKRKAFTAKRVRDA